MRAYKPRDIFCVNFAVKDCGKDKRSGNDLWSIDGIHVLKITTNSKGVYHVGKTNLYTQSEFLAVVLELSIGAKNIIVVGPDMRFLLACSDIRAFMKAGNWQIKTGMSEFKLSDQYIDSPDEKPIFVDTERTFMLSLWDDATKRAFVVLDACNWGLDTYSNLLPLARSTCQEAACKNHLLHHNSAYFDHLNTVLAHYLCSICNLGCTEQIGGVKYSLGGFSGGFMGRFGVHKKYKEHTNELALALEYGCYQTSRVEAMGYGHYADDVYIIDYSSFYPSIAVNENLPVKLHQVEVKPSVEFADELTTVNFGFACVDLKTEIPAYPYFNGKRVVFPVGEFQAYIAGPELKSAINLGHVQRVHSLAVYETGEPLREVMDYLLTKRAECRTAYDQMGQFIYKRLANALIGKTAQCCESWEHMPEHISLTDWGKSTNCNLQTGETYDVVTIDGESYKVTKGIYMRETFPAIASAVNAIARYKIWQIIQQVGLRNVLAVTGDGLILNSAGYCVAKYMLCNDGNKPGFLRLVSASDHLHLVSPTVYRTSCTHKHAGFAREHKLRPYSLADSLSSPDDSSQRTPDEWRKAIRKFAYAACDDSLDTAAHTPWVSFETARIHPIGSEQWALSENKSRTFHRKRRPY